MYCLNTEQIFRELKDEWEERRFENDFWPDQDYEDFIDEETLDY